MTLVSTTVLTFDNETLVVPNRKIWGDVIKNVTAQERRRVDLTFSIGHAEDLERVEKLFASVLEAHPKILKEPAPTIKLNELTDRSMDFVVRPWVKTEDYWEVYWDVTRAVKQRLDSEGMGIPFSKHDVHIHERRSEDDDSRRA